MKRLAFVLLAPAAAAPLAFLGPDRARTHAGPAGDLPLGDLVVHEWGTFTSMQGSDGVTLDGLQHEEEGLPDFVYSRTKVRECPLRDRGYKGLEVDVTNVTEKMETPVTYFYSDRPGRVHVRVGFEHGLLSQWYPVSDLLGPPERRPEDGPLDMSKVDRSFLDWKIDVLPKGEGLSDVPAVAEHDPWRFARIPDSNCVRTAERESPRLGPVETEKFLFYRGLGRFTLPLRAVTAPGGRITLFNDGEDAVRHVVVVHVRDGHAMLDTAQEVGARSSVDLECPVSMDGPKLEEVLPKLERVLQDALVEEGLYAKEAEAMTKTWERSYFRAEGLRILYVVPERVTNALLPIAIDPTPKAIRRVLVGRLECITPEVEAEVAAALAARRSSDESARQAAEERLARLGRFLEPHLRRVIAATKDGETREAAEELLKSVGR